MKMAAKLYECGGGYYESDKRFESWDDFIKSQDWTKTKYLDPLKIVAVSWVDDDFAKEDQNINTDLLFLVCQSHHPGCLRFETFNYEIVVDKSECDEIEEFIRNNLYTVKYL
jgi:hypothetical protein